MNVKSISADLDILLTAAPMALLCATLALVGCSEDEPLAPNSVGELASIELGDGGVVSFTQTANDEIIVAEIMPGNVPSRVAQFAVESATPLEIYLALSDEEPPRALAEHHDNFTSAPPRDLATDFRTSYTGSRYQADCSEWADLGWFSNLYQGTGWTNWKYSTATYWGHELVLNCQHFITHVCNFAEYNGSDPIALSVFRFGDWRYTLWDIDVGERGVIYVLGTEAATYWQSDFSVLHPSSGQTNAYRQGMMAP